MWLHYKDDPNNVGTKIAIPVRYEMNGYNSLLGSHYDHYYLDYDSFDSDPIPDDIFKLDSSISTFICCIRLVTVCDL